MNNWEDDDWENTTSSKKSGKKIVKKVSKKVLNKRSDDVDWESVPMAKKSIKSKRGGSKLMTKDSPAPADPASLLSGLKPTTETVPVDLAPSVAIRQLSHDAGLAVQKQSSCDGAPEQVKLAEKTERLEKPGSAHSYHSVPVDTREGSGNHNATVGIALGSLQTCRDEQLADTQSGKQVGQNSASTDCGEVQMDAATTTQQQVINADAKTSCESPLARNNSNFGSPEIAIHELKEQLQVEQTFRRELEVTIDTLTESKERLRDDLLQKLKKEERRSKALAKERDMLRRSVDSVGETEDRFRLKEEQVNSLMEEGEKLSRQLGDKESHIRKMRAEVKALETDTVMLKDRLNATETKLKTLQEAHTILEADDKEIKRELVDTSKKNMHLTAQLEEQERIMKSLRAENAELSKDLSEARDLLSEHKVSLARAAEDAGSASAEAAERAKSEMREKMSAEQREFEDREKAITSSLDELRLELERKTNELGRLEDRLRKEVIDADRRCQDAEARCQDLERLVPEATRPLLRQIESLQRAQTERVSVWQGLERSFQQQLQEAQAAAVIAGEREKASIEKLSKTNTRLALSEEKLRTAERNSADLQYRASCVEEEMASLDKNHQKRRDEDLRDADNRLKKAVEEERRLWSSKDQQRSAEFDLRLTEVKHAADDRTALLEAEIVKLKDTAKTAIVAPVPEGKAYADQNDSYIFEVAGGAQGTVSNTSGLIGLETLQARLRQKEAELRSAQSSATAAEATNAALAEELASVTADRDRLASDTSAATSVQVELDTLQRRHAVALEILGEKDEELNVARDELVAAREDLTDIKNVYKELLSARFCAGTS